MSLIEIGKIVKAQGLSGEVKVMPYADDENMGKLSYVYVGENGQKCDVVKAVCRLGFCFVTLAGVDDRTKAEKLVGQVLFIDKADLSVAEGECIIDDLIGMKVILSSGEDYGEIVMVEQYGSADVITLNGKFGKWQFPFINDVVESVDKSNKIMVLNAKRFEEIKV